MNILAPQVGIDVDKSSLVFCTESGKPFRIANREDAIKKYLETLPEGSQIHLESSGGYERLARRVLEEAGFEVRVHNPLKTRRLAQARGTRAKTDPLDARGLARSGSLLPATCAKALDRQALADISRTIEAIRETIGRYKVRMQRPELAALAREALADVVEALESKAAQLSKEFEALVQTSPWMQAYKLCRSIPGVGPVTARLMVSELPEDFMQRSSAQLCSYAGLAPIDDSSGGRRGVAHVGKGNSRLKKAMYMPAVWSLSKQDWARDLYRRLRSKGKSHRAAIMAVMRRLLIRIVAVLHRGSPWEPEPAIP
jgi:transposase